MTPPRPPLTEPRPPLLAAFTALFAEQSYAETSFDQLLAASGLDPGAFEAIFLDREHCFLHLYEQIVETGRDRILASFPAEASWPVQLAAGLRALLGLVDAHPAEARVVFVEAAAATPATHLRQLASIEACASFFAVGRANAATHVPSMLDSALPGGLAFMLGLHLKRGSDEPTLGLYPELLRLLLLPYLGEERTAGFVAVAESVSARKTS